MMVHQFIVVVHPVPVLVREGFCAGRDSALALNQIIIRDGLFEIPVRVIMIKKGYKKLTNKLSILVRTSSNTEFKDYFIKYFE